jgi:hypothetical protein
MTPKAIVLANIANACDGRIGLNFNENRVNDMAGAGCGHGIATRKWVEGNVEYSTDLWGNVWHRFVGMSQGGEVCKPILPEWDALDTLELPPLDDPANFEAARNLGASGTDKFTLGSMPGWPFAVCRYMRRMEVYFMDLLVERERLAELHDRVTTLLEGVIDRFGEAGLDGIFFCEDMGTQDRLLMSPDTWRDVFAPLNERLCGRAHAHGMKVIQHSCGYNWQIIDDLCASGIDCLQFDQPSVYDQPALAEKLRGHGVGLFSPVDIQQVLPTGDRALIEAEVKRLVENFRGGFIAKNYPDLAGIGVEPAWDRWAYEAFLRYGAPELYEQAATAEA